jgi:hypothetical protein
MWGSFVLGYPAQSTSRNPLAVAAHNLDLRLTQRQWLQQLFHLNELIWRSATSAIAAATDEELHAVTAVLALVGQFRIGEPLPDTWSKETAHLTNLAREAKRQRRQAHDPEPPPPNAPDPTPDPQLDR